MRDLKKSIFLITRSQNLFLIEVILTSQSKQLCTIAFLFERNNQRLQLLRLRASSINLKTILSYMFIEKTLDETIKQSSNNKNV